MKVLFLYPEGAKSGYKPNGLSLLIALLKKNNHEVRLFETSTYNFGYKKDHEVTSSYTLFKKSEVPEYGKVSEGGDVDADFKKAVEEFKPDVLATTMTYLTRDIAFRLLDHVDGKKFPVIAGGIHCTLCPDDAISHRNIDAICRGEGEGALLDFMKAVKSGADFSNIKNLWVKKGSTIVKNEMRPFYQDLDSLPYIDWSLFGENYFWRPFRGNAYRWGEFAGSRGCYYSCTYCFYSKYYELYNVKKKTIRWMSPERVIDELEYLVKTYDLQFLKFIDSDFSARDMDSLARLSELYVKKINLPFVFQGYADYITKEKVQLLKKMKCVSIAMGLESGSPEIRKEVLHRAMKDEVFLDAVENIKEAGIRVTSLNMIGIPTETRENIFETIELNRKAKVDVADVTFLYPFPGTKIRDLAEDKHFIKEDKKDINFRAESILDMPQISSRELKGIMKNFQLYVSFPKLVHPFVRMAEADNAVGNCMHNILSKLHYFNKYVIH